MPQTKKLLSRRPLHIAAAFVCIVCLSIVGAEAWRSLASRDQQTKENIVATGNLARSVADHATSTFLRANVVLSGLVDRVERDGVSADRIDRLIGILKLRKRELSEFQRLSILDAEGRWIVTDLGQMDRAVTHIDREYFVYHKTHDDTAPHLGPPIKSRSSGEWIVTVSRRINHPDGGFGGVALASIKLTYFTDYFVRFDVGVNGSIVLATSDGKLIDRVPFKESLIGTDLSGGTIFRDHIPYDSSGSAWVVSKIDGVPRLVSYQKLEIFPGYAIVSVGRDDVFANWKADMITHWIATLSLVGLLTLIGGKLIRELSKRHEAQVQLVKSQMLLTAANAKLDELARLDGLTGLANRREFDRVYDAEVGRVRRGGPSLAIIMVDIDYFKAYNDALGHLEGDSCIQRVAEILRSVVSRPGDFVARYGGEEFVFLLPATDTNGAVALAEKVRTTLHALAIPHPSNAAKIVTVSLGVSVFSCAQTNRTAERALADADGALYEAKKSGRDTVRVCEEDARPASMPFRPSPQQSVTLAVDTVA